MFHSHRYDVEIPIAIENIGGALDSQASVFYPCYVAEEVNVHSEPIVNDPSLDPHLKENTKTQRDPQPDTYTETQLETHIEA